MVVIFRMPLRWWNHISWGAWWQRWPRAHLIMDSRRQWQPWRHALIHKPLLFIKIWSRWVISWRLIVRLDQMRRMPRYHWWRRTSLHHHILRWGRHLWRPRVSHRWRRHRSSLKLAWRRQLAVVADHSIRIHWWWVWPIRWHWQAMGLKSRSHRSHWSFNSVRRQRRAMHWWKWVHLRLWRQVVWWWRRRHILRIR